MNWKTTLLALFSVSLLGCANQSDTGAEPLNFIIIFTDDQGYGDLGCYGHPTIRTPELDRMASEGQRWTQFYVAAPVCTPSRAGLLTGRYPIRNGMTSDQRGVLFPNSSGGLPPSEVTLAEVLKQKNYATAMIGKWHLGHLPEFLPTNQGFDYYYGIPYSNDMNFAGDWAARMEQINDPHFQSDFRDYDVPLMENDQVVERPADQNTITQRYTEKAVEFIQQHQDTSFFLYLAHSLPHIPLFAHPDRVGNSLQGLYGDVIEEIDWSVGRILNTLTELGIDKHTLVVFTSDNGPWLLFRNHGGSAGPLRAGKGTTFEGGQRVPAVFWGPGTVKPAIVRGMGSTLDLLPTMAALSGTSLPEDRKLDGYDLSPVLKGETKSSPRSEFFYWTNADLYALRSGKWKLHLRQTAPVTYWNQVEPLEAPELYNLEADISERYNVAAYHPEVVEELLKMAADHRNDITNPLPDNLAAVIGEE